MSETSKIRAEVITRELNKNVELKTMLEYELALQKQLDPSEESVRVPARTREDGQPISWKMIKRGDYIGIITGKIDDVDLKIKTLEKL